MAARSIFCNAMKKRGHLPIPVVFFLISLFVFISGGCAGAVVPYGGKAPETVRVLISEGRKELLIAGSGASGGVRLEYGDGGRVMLNAERAEPPLRFYPDGEFIYVEKRPYRGMVEVGADGEGLFVVNEVPLESYIAGIIVGEISPRWHIEAVKAQAVIARTYAIFQKQKRSNPLYDLTSTHIDQVYLGAQDEDPASRRAVEETEGEALFYDGVPALTVYHSNGGGTTEDSGDVWGSDYPYLRSIESGYDRTSASFLWELSLHSFAIEAMLKKAGYEVEGPEFIKVTERTKTGRAKRLVIKDGEGAVLTLSGEELRRALGYSTLRSTLFDVEKNGEEFVFRGKGSGHGVGLSQWGAKGMAEEGYGYREILRHYYPGTEVRRLY